MTPVELDVAHYTFTTRCGCGGRTVDAEHKPFYREPYDCPLHGMSEALAVEFVPAQTIATFEPEPEPEPVVELEPEPKVEQKPAPPPAVVPPPRPPAGTQIPKRIIDACDGNLDQAARVFAVIEPIVRAGRQASSIANTAQAHIDATRVVTNRHLSRLCAAAGEDTKKLLKVVDDEIAVERRRILDENDSY